MKPLFFYLALLLFFIQGCAKYQVFDTSSTNSLLEGDNWVWENDTVKLTYEFWAERGIVSFSVYNKINKPIYIDWKNSSFILQGDKNNYWQDEVLSDNVAYYFGATLKPRYKASDIKGFSTGRQVGSSKSVKPERITFIPPRSFYYRSYFHILTAANYARMNPKNPNVTRNSKPKFIEIKFDQTSSPIIFRNYLAFTLSENSSQFMYIDNGFFVSTVKEMRSTTFREANNRSPFRSGTSFFKAIVEPGY